MDKFILEAWDKQNHKLKNYFMETPHDEHDSYLALLRKTIEIIFPEDEERGRLDFGLDHGRITQIDNGDYQGTLVFVVPSRAYQPGATEHWYTSVGYGSCSGCDTLKDIVECNYGKLPTKTEAEAYWTLCLHMIQKMKRMEEALG